MSDLRFIEHIKNKGKMVPLLQRDIMHLLDVAV